MWFEQSVGLETTRPMQDIISQVTGIRYAKCEDMKLEICERLYRFAQWMRASFRAIVCVCEKIHSKYLKTSPLLADSDFEATNTHWSICPCSCVASMSKVTSTCGAPLGAGGKLSIAKSPKKWLSWPKKKKHGRPLPSSHRIIESDFKL